MKNKQNYHQISSNRHLISSADNAVFFTDVEIPDDGSGDPFDFKFVRWMTKNKVSYYQYSPGIVKIWS